MRTIKTKQRRNSVKRRLCSLTLAAVCILSSAVGVYAEEKNESGAAVFTEIQNQTVKVVVSGKLDNIAEGEPVSFYLSKNGEPACVLQSFVGVDGAYRFGFLANPAFGGGEFDYRISAWNSVAQKGQMEIADIQGLKNLLLHLPSVSSAGDVEKLASKIEPAVNMPVFDEIQIADWCGVLYHEISNGNFPADIEGLYCLIKQSVAVAAVNRNAPSVIIDGALQYLEVLNADAESVTAYKNELSAKGIEAVNRNFTADSYRGIEDCVKSFRKLVLTNRITGNASGDLSVAQERLLADGEELGLSISKAAGKEKEVTRRLVKSGAQTPEELLKAYDEICADLTSERGGGSSSGGGAGGGRGSVDESYEPYIQATPVNADVIVSGFSDMADFSWAEKAVAELKKMGAVNGKTETEFAPKDFVTREEFVKMVLQAFGLTQQEDETSEVEKAVRKSQFSDVDTAAWYAPFVERAVKLGIVMGFSETEFGVGQRITRQDMATMSLRALRYRYNDFDTNMDDVQFTDLSEIDEYARIPALLLKKHRILSGYPDGSFRPAQFANRAEAAQMVYRMLIFDTSAQS